MEVPLVEFSPLRDDCLLGGRVVEAPALVALGIAQEDAFLHVRSKALPLVLLHKHIGSAAPDANVAHFWLLLVPGLVGGLVRQGRGGEAISDVDLRPKCPVPEGVTQTSFMQHGSDVLLQSPVGPLCISVLLGPVASGVPPLNATGCQEAMEGKGHVFSALVVVQGLDFEPQRVLSPCLELLERLKRV